MRQKNHSSDQSKKKDNSIRIIGGKLRGRKIDFPDAKGLRPTSDRVRETIFNWLMNDIFDSVCLDVFSGSGAFGFEALSRGAKLVEAIEKSVEASSTIQKNIDKLKLDNFFIYQRKFIDVKLTQSFDIIFLDPPFEQNLLPEVFSWLEYSHAFKLGTKIVIESDKSFKPPEHFHCLKEKKAGNVFFSLYEYKGSSDESE